MAFTLGTFVADPTLTAGDVRLSAFALDPTLTTGNARAAAFSLDPTLVLSGGRLPLVLLPGVQQLQRIQASSTAEQTPNSSATLQRITASGTAVEAPTGRSTCVLQAILASSAANSGALVGPQLISASGTAVTGSTTGFNLPAALPYPIASGFAASNDNLSQAVLPGVRANGVAVSGVAGVSHAALQLLSASGAAGVAAVGTSRVFLPLLQAGGMAVPATGATFSAVVLQTITQGLTTYSNFTFNSFARFNGLTLAAGDAGLFTLEGDNDDGAQIDAGARGGITDFGTSFRKRVERVYVNFRASDDMLLRVYTDEIDVRDYLLRTNRQGGLHGNHVALGRGLEALNWQFELRNRNGCDFSLNRIEVKPYKLGRRIGGKDA